MTDILKSNVTSSTPLGQKTILTHQKRLFKTPKSASDDKHITYPSWYDPKTCIYHSKHRPVNLPTDPFVNAVSYLFSHKHMGKTALIDYSTGFSIPNMKLFSLVKAMASGLHQMGIRKGDAVLILLPSSIYFPIIFLAVLSVGAVVTPMNSLSNLLEIQKQTRDCKIKLVFTTPDKVDEVRGLGFSGVAVPENVASDDSALHKLISSDPSLAPRPEINQQDTAEIMFSSGTSGACKGVELTHRNFIAMIALFVRFEASQYEEFPWENVYLAVLPMFHIFGLALFVMGLLSLGTTIVVMRRFDGDDMVRATERYGVTHFPVVPPLMAALTRKAKSVAKGRLKILKQVSCGAAPLTTKSIDEFVRTLPRVDFIQGYGTTEATAVATRGYNTKQLRNYTSVGLLAPNTEAKVVDYITGSFLPPAGVGELWLHSPGVRKAYLNNVEATKATVDDNGWLHTGDIVCFDQNGYLYILDRLKEVIKYKGFQIAPADLESVLMSHPDVIDAAVTAVTDEEAGEIPVAFVVRKNGSALSEASLMDFVATKVAPYKKVRKVCYTSSIPRSAAGKILRKELKNFFSSRL